MDQCVFRHFLSANFDVIGKPRKSKVLEELQNLDNFILEKGKNTGMSDKSQRNLSFRKNINHGNGKCSSIL